MSGEAVGNKGLDIKGKSAKAGKISGFVPSLQIYEEEHKTRIRTLPKTATMRIFYKNSEHRDQMMREMTDPEIRALDEYEGKTLFGIEIREWSSQACCIRF